LARIIAKGLKKIRILRVRYREYPSLIKGGHASYQLDISNQRIGSTETTVNVLVALNHHGLELNMEGLKRGGIVLHVTPVAVSGASTKETDCGTRSSRHLFPG